MAGCFADMVYNDAPIKVTVQGEKQEKNKGRRVNAAGEQSSKLILKTRPLPVAGFYNSPDASLDMHDRRNGLKIGRNSSKMTPSRRRTLGGHADA